MIYLWVIIRWQDTSALAHSLLMVHVVLGSGFWERGVAAGHIAPRTAHYLALENILVFEFETNNAVEEHLVCICKIWLREVNLYTACPGPRTALILILLCF